MDVLFHSVAQEFGLTAVGILMTGMGEDGAEGLGAMKAAGGLTIAQSEDTCVVGGMPRAAIVKGYANKILPLQGLGPFLIAQYGNYPPVSEKQESFDKSEKSERPEKNEKVPVSTPRG